MAENESVSVPAYASGINPTAVGFRISQAQADGFRACSREKGWHCNPAGATALTTLAEVSDCWHLLTFLQQWEEMDSLKSISTKTRCERHWHSRSQL